MNLRLITRLQARYSAEPIRDQYRFDANVFC